MTARELVAEVRRDPMERLRWRVLSRFGVLPCSREAREMTDEDCLRYAAHILADRSGDFGVNASFDSGRYSALAGVSFNG